MVNGMQKPMQHEMESVISMLMGDCNGDNCE